ncbi:MAG: YbjN domain-containing protein [Chloroflexota bacterium]
MALIAEQITSFLEQRHVPHSHEDDNIWYSELTAGDETHEFFIHLDLEQGWVYLTVNPFVPTPEPDCLDNVARHLARLNFDVTLAKFVIDDEGDVALTVELPIEDLALTHLATAITALGNAAGENYDEVLNLAQDETAISSYW